MVIDENRIRERFAALVSSREFEPTLRRVFPSQLWRLVLALVSLSTVVGAPIGLYQLYRAVQLRRSAKVASFLKAIPRSRFIEVSVHMANRAVYKEIGAVAPGLVMGSFDAATANDKEFMHELFMKVSLLGMTDAEGPEEKQAARMMADEVYTPGRRRLLPTGLTRGKLVYLFDLQIVGNFRPGGKLDPAKLPCLAEPGPVGQIAMIPWWIAEGLDDPEGRI
jgi:hypothetical protein